MMSFWDKARQWLAQQAVGQERTSRRAMAEALGMYIPSEADEIAVRFARSRQPRPSGPAQPSPPASPPVRVVINPGHAPGAGGAPGAHINEADATGWIADLMPQQSDDRVTYEVQRQQGGDLNGLAGGLRADQRPIVVSIHLDSGPPRNHTAKVIYRGNDPDPVRREKSQRLSDCLGAAVAQVPVVGESTSISIPDPGGRVRFDSLAVLNETATDAAVLVEVGFVTNPQIEAFVRTPQGQQQIAHAIDRGIRDYLDTPQPAARPAQAPTRPAPPGRGAPPAPGRAAPARPVPAPARPAPLPRRAAGAPTTPQPPRGRNDRRGY
jgi:N-acetylmuramoyl-L-alanine amidase